MRKGEEGGRRDAHSKTLWGRETKVERRAMMGKVEPIVLPTKTMKTDAMRRPVWVVEPPPEPQSREASDMDVEREWGSS